MIRKCLYIIFCLLLVTTPAFGATLIFSTGFETDVSVEAAGATTQSWTDCDDGVEGYGCEDSSTGYIVPIDIPGHCLADPSDCADGNDNPFWNIISATSTAHAAIETTPSNCYAGNQCIKLYNDDYYETSTGRIQNVQYPEGGASLSSGNNYARTHFKFRVKIPAFPTSGCDWHIIAEWKSNSNTRVGVIQFGYNDATHTDVSYYGGANSYNDKNYGTQVTILNSDWENKWIEMRVFQEVASSGHFILDFKLDGDDPVNIITWSGNNTSEGNPSNFHFPKSYGCPDDAWTQWIDDWRWYASTGYTDLADFDDEGGEPPPPPPSGLVTQFGPTPIANVTQIGPTAIANITQLLIWDLEASGKAVIAHDQSEHSNATPSTSATVTIDPTDSLSNKMALIGVGWDKGGSAATVSSVTYDGNACTEIGSLAYTPGTYNGVAFYYCDEADIDDNSADVVATLSGTAAISVGVTILYNVKQQAPESTDTDTGTASSGSTTVTSTAGAWVVSVANNANSTTENTPDQGTERWEDILNQRTTMATIYEDSAGSKNFDWTFGNSQAYGIITASFEAADL